MSANPKSTRILVTPTRFRQNDPRLRTGLEATVGDVVYNQLGHPLTAVEVREKLRGMDEYIAGLDKINREGLMGADVLKVIARYGVGVDNVDLEHIAQKSIVATNTPDANSVSVAKLTIGLLVALARYIPRNSSEVRCGDWPRTHGLTVQGKTVGLLGFGSIGKEVARRLRGWICRVLAQDLYPDHATAHKLGVELTSFDELLSQADFLSLHLPLLPETCLLVNSTFLSEMKREAFLVNTARGELVDEAVLADALQNGQLRGAGLDALSEEPPIPRTSFFGCRRPT